MSLALFRLLLLCELEHVVRPFTIAASLLFGDVGKVCQSVAMLSSELLLDGLQLIGNAIHQAVVLLGYETLG